MTPSLNERVPLLARRVISLRCEACRQRARTMPATPWRPLGPTQNGGTAGTAQLHLLLISDLVRKIRGCSYRGGNTSV
jgi:hypothetical protein